MPPLSTAEKAPPSLGFVPTPDELVDLMVGLLFEDRPVSPSSRVLDPGCGPGAFISGVLRWSEQRGVSAPHIVGVELDQERGRGAAELFRGRDRVEIRAGDFLTPSAEQFDFIIGNPPYVSILHLSSTEKSRYRTAYSVAKGRFDLYMLFFEQALRMLAPGGRLVFITPEKFLYVQAAASLRRLLARHHVKEIRLVDEASFPAHVTYPTITVVEKSETIGLTRVTLRDGTTRALRWPSDGASILPLLSGQTTRTEGPTLEDVALRVSCGVATGADEIFVRETASLPARLRKFAHPTIAGRQLVQDVDEPVSTDSMLLPYDESGTLLSEAELGALGNYLLESRDQLSRRVCARRKPWYAFHDSVPLTDIKRPKILCKDVASEPAFWLDRSGEIVPRHSVYYVVPKDPAMLEPLADWLRGPHAREWLLARCPRAANGFLRLQSNVLKQLPVPPHLSITGKPQRISG